MYSNVALLAMDANDVDKELKDAFQSLEKCEELHKTGELKALGMNYPEVASNIYVECAQLYRRLADICDAYSARLDEMH